MYLRVTGSIVAALVAALFLLRSSAAEESGAVRPEFQLNLEQFPDTANRAGTQTRDLELNLEQFDNSDLTEPLPADGELKLNLDQFDNAGTQQSDDLELNLDQFENNNQKPVVPDSSDSSNKPATQINNTGSRSTVVEKTGAQKYNYLPHLIGCSLVFIVFLIVLSRRRRNR